MHGELEFDIGPRDEMTIWIRDRRNGAEFEGENQAALVLFYRWAPWIASRLLMILMRLRRRCPSSQLQHDLRFIRTLTSPHHVVPEKKQAHIASRPKPSVHQARMANCLAIWSKSSKLMV
jgi:hypothetical protein